MPKVHTQTARKDIYRIGARIPSNKTKSGFRRDRSIPADENDKVIINAGQVYYWWKFRNSGKIISTKYPPRSQLTQSGYLSAIYEISDTADQDDVAGMVQELVTLRDECQDSLDNMPEHLRDTSESGQLLTDRIEALESAIECGEELQQMIDDRSEWKVDYDLGLEDEPHTEDEIEEKFDEFLSMISDAEI